jgi:lipid-A-disaccharide synthase-like uncharacterized protein
MVPPHDLCAVRVFASRHTCQHAICESSDRSTLVLVFWLGLLRGDALVILTLLRLDVSKNVRKRSSFAIGVCLDYLHLHHEHFRCSVLQHIVHCGCREQISFS